MIVFLFRCHSSFLPRITVFEKCHVENWASAHLKELEENSQEKLNAQQYWEITSDWQHNQLQQHKTHMHFTVASVMTLSSNNV